MFEVREDRFSVVLTHDKSSGVAGCEEPIV